MPYAGEKWEYKVKNFDLGYKPNEIEDELNNQGNNGWILFMFFRRKDKMLLVYGRKKLA